MEKYSISELFSMVKSRVDSVQKEKEALEAKMKKLSRCSSSSSHHDLELNEEKSEEQSFRRGPLTEMQCKPTPKIKQEIDDMPESSNRKLSSPEIIEIIDSEDEGEHTKMSLDNGMKPFSNWVREGDGKRFEDTTTSTPKKNHVVTSGSESDDDDTAPIRKFMKKLDGDVLKERDNKISSSSLNPHSQSLASSGENLEESKSPTRECRETTSDNLVDKSPNLHRKERSQSADNGEGNIVEEVGPKSTSGDSSDSEDEEDCDLSFRPLIDMVRYMKARRQVGATGYIPSESNGGTSGATLGKVPANRTASPAEESRSPDLAGKRSNADVIQSVGVTEASKVVINGAEPTLEQSVSIAGVAGVDGNKIDSASHVSNYLGVEHNEEGQQKEDAQVEVDKVKEENTSESVEGENEENFEFGGGPTDKSVIYQFKKHIAYKLWDKEFPTVLTCRHHYGEMTCWDLGKESADVQKIVCDSGLVNLSKFPKRYINHVLITAFVERWHGETNTFHLPFGEMTITIDDIHHITGVPSVGKPLKRTGGQSQSRSTNREKLRNYLVDGIGAKKSAVEKVMTGSKTYSVTLAWIRENCTPKSDRTKNGVEKRARAYLFWLLGNTVMSDKSGNRVNIYLLESLMELDMVQKFNWGAGLLALLYQQLTNASRGSRQLASYVPVIEVWINDHFPRFCTGGRVEPDFDEGQPHIYKWTTQAFPGNAADGVIEYREILDDLSAEDVIWDPFCGKRDLYPLQPITWFTGSLVMFDNVQAYNPERVLRQMGRVQRIPSDPVRNVKIGKEAICYFTFVSGHLEDWENHLLGVSRRTIPVRNPWDCSPNYDDWFKAISHPQVQNPKSRRTTPQRSKISEKQKLIQCIAEALAVLDDETHAELKTRLKHVLGPKYNVEERYSKKSHNKRSGRDVVGSPNNKKARTN